MSQKPVAVIVGASRGIGLELCRLYLSQSNMHLVALSRDAEGARKAILDSTHRPPLLAHINGSTGGSQAAGATLDAKDLSSFDGSRLTTLGVDIKDESSIQSASKQVKEMFGDESLRLLFNVAGILNVEKNVAQVDYKEMLEQFQINTFAPLLSMKHFVPLMAKKSQNINYEDETNGLIPQGLGVIANMSARVGSIQDNQKGGWYSYRGSKAAQNQFTKCMALELTMRKMPSICVGLHPGTVRTSLSAPFTGGPGGKERKPGQNSESEEERRARGEFEADEAASRLAGVIAHLTQEKSGKVWDHRLEEIPY